MRPAITLPVNTVAPNAPAHTHSDLPPRNSSFARLAFQLLAHSSRHTLHIPAM